MPPIPIPPFLKRTYYDTGAMVNNPATPDSYYGPDSIVNNGGGGSAGYTNPNTPTLPQTYQPTSSTNPFGPASTIHDSNGVNGGAIAGGVIGGVVALAALFLLWRVIQKRKANGGAVRGEGKGEGKDMANVMGKLRERFARKGKGGDGEGDVKKGVGMGEGRSEI
ncbi:MAG: hypothetical protein L6R42_007192 [Xanthoria sp. 1 TBL-2021]|nr:MAG: hypothetical protein L6R42_007192 [Xanthoria sp. 1 TBL-2021]